MGRLNSFDSLTTLDLSGERLHAFSLAAARRSGLEGIDRLPVSLRIVFENLLRHEDGVTVTADDIRALAAWPETRAAGRDIGFFPSRVVMPDSSGVPLLADLAALRDAMVRLGGDPETINPLCRADLVVDHSVIVDLAGRPDALAGNMEREFARNGERYAFLRWAQQAFRNLRIVPPGVGIVHQVNVELFASVVDTVDMAEGRVAIPDTVLGMDSHTPMVNALGVLGWGCGGIEAGAALLGQPVSLRIPEVVGVRLVGRLGRRATATDLVLTVTEALRRHGVVQKFVEFCGPGVADLILPERATLANMAPEYGATVGLFPVDRETVAYLTLSGRDAAHVARVEAYARAQGLWREPGDAEPVFTDVVEIDLGAVTPSVAGPRRPQDRVPLAGAADSAAAAVEEMAAAGATRDRVAVAGKDVTIGHGDVALAAITSCTNTSNPLVMLAAGLLARNAVARGLAAKPWVKTSLAPGSRVVADYLAESGLQGDLDRLGFHVVGFGCTTCMGNSGPLDPAVGRAIDDNGLIVGAVLSGNRNFEGRVHPQCRLAYLASPPLVVAYAIAGTLAIDLTREPLGTDGAGRPVFLDDIWPDRAEVAELAARVVSSDLFRRRYASAFEGDARWRALPMRGGATFDWDDGSTYLRQPGFFAGIDPEADPVADLVGARALVILGDSVTTDHISPVGAIAVDGEAGRYLVEQGVAERDFNAFVTRRVNHDVMIRGTFGSPRLRNELVGGREGGLTRVFPGGAETTVFDAAMRYGREGVPLVVVAGRDYGAGSSRDWAAKGTRLLGLRAVIAESLERIHRSNLIGMGVLPLEFPPGVTRHTLGLDGTQTFHIDGLDARLGPRATLPCRIEAADGTAQTVTLTCRLDTALEVEYFRQGGFLPMVLRRLMREAA